MESLFDLRVASSAPPSCNASRTTSPVPQRRVTSCPASPRASAKRLTRAHGLLVPPPPSSPMRGLRRHHYHATFGNDPRNANPNRAWPAQKVRTPDLLGVPRTPEMCRVHAYSTMSSTLTRSGATAFGNAGKASRGVRSPPTAGSSGPPIHSYAPMYTSFGNAGGATFGTPHATPRRLHSGLGCRSGLMCAAMAPRELSHGRPHSDGLPRIAAHRQISRR